MSDHIKGFIVSLDADYREEEAAEIARAIGHIRGVAGVECSATDPVDWMARSQVRAQIREKLYAAFKEVLG